MVFTSQRPTDIAFDETLRAAQTGEEWAWEVIYRGLVGPVTGYLAGRGAVEPEDLASEVFLQVARDIPRFDGDESSFRSWVFVIAHRRLIDSRRAAARRPKTTPYEQVGAHTSIGGDVEDEAVADLADIWIREVFETLTDEQRNVITLRVIADLSVEETAMVMDKRPGAIKALQRRALIAIRRQIEEGRVSL